METNKYQINYNKEDIIGCYVRQWVLEWCKKYHPEAFVEAKKFVEEYLNENKN